MNEIRNTDLPGIFENILKEMQNNKDYLIELDSIAGDGDLGISMVQGFSGLVDELAKLDIPSMKPNKIILKAAMALNEYSPSSLGTILCAGLMGGAKALGDRENLDVVAVSEFVDGMLEGIMKRAGSGRGEKTILDAIGGASDALHECVETGATLKDSVKGAAEGARKGMELTRDMMAVHGRAAYYREKSIGNLDGGAAVGMLFFKAMNESID